LTNIGKSKLPVSRALLAATSYPRDARDWQGRFIFDQAAALARQGVEVSLWAPLGDLPVGVNSALAPGDALWLNDLLVQGGIAHLLRRRPLAGVWAGWQLLRRLRGACHREAGRPASADFYLIDWLQNALALPDDGRPALVTVLGSDYRLLDLPGMAFALRRQFRRRKTVLMPNAAWMAPRLQTLFGDVARVEPNPFGVAAEWFAVERRPVAERKGWLVVSRITRGKLGTLLEWGSGLFSPERSLYLLGPLQDNIDLPPWVIHPGATNPKDLRETWFPQVAGLLTLSQHDEGRPQVLIEAMAAGLPVIASNISAHADLIRHGETGWLVADRQALADALALAENPETEARVSKAARDFVVQQIGTWDDCARRYVAAYRNLLEVENAM
jgi:hypothetical protein